MPTTLPELTLAIDNAFIHTWYKTKPEAVDNILDATVVWAALKERGCLQTQVGGKYIEETVRYGKKTVTEVKKGDILPSGETESETEALFDWKYFASHAQRSLFDDQVNSGPAAVKKLVETQLGLARDALVEKCETVLFGTFSATAETTDKTVQGLNEMIPPNTNKFTYTYGKIARPTSATAGNIWWIPKYKVLSSNPEVNLLSDMKNLYNTIAAGQAAPNLIITNQTLFELFEDFAIDMTQLVKDDGSNLADLGYDVLRYRGKQMIWTPAIEITSYENQMLMLNTDYIKVVYDPNLWFDMTNWKDIPLQGERIAHILCAMNVISNQLRRHGRLYPSGS